MKPGENALEIVAKNLSGPKKVTYDMFVKIDDLCHVYMSIFKNLWKKLKDKNNK